MPSTPRRSEPVLPLEQRRRDSDRTRGLGYALMLALVTGLLSYVPLPPHLADAGSWWPFGGSETAPESEVTDVAVGDGTAEMEVDWVDETPEADGADPEPVDFGTVEARPQSLDLQTEGGAVTGYVEGASVEQVGERTATTTVFANPDGTETLRFYEAPAFVEDGDGGFVPIDPTLAQEGGRWSPEAAADVSFADTASDTDLVRFALDGGTQVQYGLDGAKSVAAQADGNQITYAGILPATDLRFTAAGWGAKADIVLHEADAGAEWTFPLTLDAVTAEVDRASGEVRFLDANGTPVAVVPAGFAEDADIRPETGEGERTYALEYAIVPHGSGTALQVSLDEDWLRDPTRVFPVTVDPTLSEANGITSGDTYVMKPHNANYSGEGEIKVGYVDGQNAAGLLKFDTTMAALDNKYIRGATLSLYNTYSYSCSARTVNIHRITQSWSANSNLIWPGPSYAATPLASKRFAHGYSSSCGDAWETFTLDRGAVTRWVHGKESFFGFRIEGPRTDEAGWKKFASKQSSIVKAMPFMDVVYSDQGATYELPNGGFTTAVTAAQTGTVPVKVTNWGSATWKAGTGYQLRVQVQDRNGKALRASEGPFYPTSDVAPHASTTINAKVAPLQPGRYRLVFTMVDPSGKWFTGSPYHIPVSYADFDVPDLPPQITGNSPAHGATIDSVQPSLWVKYNDVDSAAASVQYSYKICRDKAATDCKTSGWLGTPAWKIPAGFLSWDATAYWFAQVSDGNTTSPLTPALELTPQPAQPPVTSHLAGASDGSTVPGLNPQIGNFTTTVTDAQVAAVGPTLAAQRTYNSQDLRTAGAFGTGWSTPWDQRLTVEPESTVLVVLESGRTVRFGKNPDGTFASPLGESFELQATGTGFRMQDTGGQTREFNTTGQLVRITDAFGRSQTLTYTSGKLTKVTDDASGRFLTLAWTGAHVTAVVVPAATTGGTASRWTYTYSGDLLTKACTPLSTVDCTTYQYESTSFYEATVQDANPKAYYTFDEVGVDSVLSNRAADKAGEYDARKVGLLHTPVGGALAASDGRALDLGAGGVSAAQLPAENVFGGSVTIGIELWFRAEPGERGTMFSIQKTDDGTTPACYNPLLFLDTAGVLRSGLYMGSGTSKVMELTSAGAVDDGKWHHVVVSTAATAQSLYLDGALIDSESGRSIDQATCGQALIGNGWGTASWPGMPTTGSAYYPYPGELDDLSLYRRTLTAEEIAFRFRAGNSGTARMTSVTNDQGHGLWTVDYDRTTGRVLHLTDANGATWDLSDPQMSDSKRSVTLASSYGKSERYTYDAEHGGRLVSRADAIGTAAWEYNDAGFVDAYTDEVGLTTAYTTDDKGRRTEEKVCRAEDDCSTTRTGYYTATDPFDLRDGRVLWQADGRSSSATDTTYRTTYTYNTQGQLLTTVYPGSASSIANPNGTASITYTTGSEAAVGGGTVPAGLVLTITDETGAATSNAYNKSGDLAETVTAAGQVTRYGYDLLGRLTSTQIGSYADGQFRARDTVTETLDALGNTVTRTGTAFTNPVTGAVHRLQQTYTYDQLGRLDTASSWDEAKPAQVRTTGYDYDAAGRLTATHYPDGSTQTQRWNDAGLLAAETASTGLELAYAYDERGRLLTTSAVGAGVDPADPAATELLLEYRTYYHNDWAASVTDALGRKTSWEYWGDGTVKRDLHTAPDGTETVTAQFDYDKARNRTQTTDAVGTVTQTSYNTRNWPTATIVDPGGITHSANYAYDKTGRTIRVIHQFAGATYKTDRTSYNAAGSVTKTYATAPAVEGECRSAGGYSCVVAMTANTYTSEGLLASAQTGTDGAETYTYNSLGQVQTATGPAREVWVDGIDKGAQSPITTYGYNAFGEPTHHKDADGNITETVYNTSGQPVLTILPGDTVAGSDVPVQPQITTAYRPGGLVASETDPRGATTSYTYDRYGRSLAVTGPDPDSAGSQTAPVTSYTYDRAGQLLATTDPNGTLATATYDSFGRTATVSATERTGTAPAYFTTSYTYDNAGQLLTETAPSGAKTSHTYDTLGRTKTVTDPAGVTTAFTYPTATSTVAGFADGGDGTARRQVTVTDILGNPVKETSETNTGSGWATVQCAQARYDLAGRPIAETTIQRRTCAAPDTTYTYDTAGQLTAITGTVSDTSAITVALGYDQLGHQTRTVDGNSNITIYGFNDWGLQDTTIEPATTTAPDLADRTWTTGFDLAGNAVEQHLPGGVTQTAEYDLLGRKTTESGTGAEAATTIKHYTWDGVGNLTGFSSDLGDTTVDYNDRGLITAITGTQTSAYEYNGDGQVIERTDAAGTTAFTYDKGRLRTLADPLTNTIHTYQWRSDGQLGSITSGQATRTFAYGGYGQLTGDAITAGGKTKSIAYEYDGQLLTAKTTAGLPNAGTQAYGYDQQGRLTSWTDTTGIETTYTWDANSNRIAVNRWDTVCGDQAATTRLYVYDERNQLTEAMDGPLQCVQSGGTWQPRTTTPVADETWTYTPRGTTATHTDAEGAQTVYAFDAFEQLKTAAVNGDSVMNQYDALGRLVARNGNTNFAYDGLTNNLTATPTSTGGIDRIVRDPAGGIISQTQGGITGLSWTNTHGDLTAVINPTTGDIIAGGGHDPFGNPLPATTDTTLGFQGGYTDPTTGETNAHARWYTPSTGTFTSRDTWQLSPSPIAQTNRYLYGNASPQNHTDPSGHGIPSKMTIGGAVGVGGGTYGGVAGITAGVVATGACLIHCADAFEGSNTSTSSSATSATGSNTVTERITLENGSTLVCTAGGNCWINAAPGGGNTNTSGGGGGGGGCSGCSGGGGSAGNPWRPAPPRIDWNAFNTRPDDTAQEAAHEAPAEIDVLNGALAGNNALIDELENQNIIITDENGNIDDINWQDSDFGCKSEYAYGPAPMVRESPAGTKSGKKAFGAAAYLCDEMNGGNEAGRGTPWAWPNTNTKVNGQYKYARCHLIAKYLGGTGIGNPNNLVTCLQYPTNSPVMSGIEAQVHDVVDPFGDEGQHVAYFSIPQYNGAGGTLSGIRIIAIGMEGYFLDKCVKNDSSGAVINGGTC